MALSPSYAFLFVLWQLCQSTIIRTIMWYLAVPTLIRFTPVTDCNFLAVAAQRCWLCGFLQFVVNLLDVYLTYKINYLISSKLTEDVF